MKDLYALTIKPAAEEFGTTTRRGQMDFMDQFQALSFKGQAWSYQSQIMAKFTIAAKLTR